MKPRIAIFGIPKRSFGEVKIWIYKNPSASHYREEVFQSSNNESEIIFDYAHSDIEFGDELTFIIMSSGICEYSYKTKYKGTDISLVPILKKQNNTTEEEISKDWDLMLWKSWDPTESQKIGLETEKKFILSKRISVAPIWESYYAESNIDYLEKFHKLWIGLNSFASQYSNETRDKNKILVLINSNLRPRFNQIINSFKNLKSEKKWKTLQKATSLDMSSDIVRDEINQSNVFFDFLELSKKSRGIFSDISNQLDGLTFLNTNKENDVFRDIFLKYHKYIGSEQGIVEPFNLSDAFIRTKSPESIIRKGKLIYHNPFLSNDSGTLFNLEDYFGTTYASQPYQGQVQQKLKDLEIIDPLFFKYLFVLYKFRCAYFHGELPSTEQNNELAKAAYQSLYKLFPAIL